MTKADTTMTGSFAFDRLGEFDDHELVLRFCDTATNLRGFIAIHNTQRGPAVGGTRFQYYQSEEEALRDALRLSHAMTYKCALANVPYGGGKAVLMAARSPQGARHQKDARFLRAYAQVVNHLGGHFITGEDVGMTKKDIQTLARHSGHIIGRPGVGSLPAHWAAVSVYESMRAALAGTYGSDSVSGKTIAIKGLGNVGLDLAKMLVRSGAQVIGADVARARILQARKEVPGITIVAPSAIHRQKVDIFSPCALGGDLSAESIASLSTAIVCGAANNQCATPEDGRRLFRRGILYIPDYIANGGGLINVVDELRPGGYSIDRVERNVARVRTTVAQVLREAKKQGRPPYQIADTIAMKRLGQRKGI